MSEYYTTLIRREQGIELASGDKNFRLFKRADWRVKVVIPEEKYSTVS